MGFSMTTFHGAIRHPELFLWDSWSCRLQDTLHLYCLALPRLGADGHAIHPDQRNQYAFHIHHFTSSNEGQTWVDAGTFQHPAEAKDRFDSGNVWSGSIWLTQDGLPWSAYTGIAQREGEHPFLQTIAVIEAESTHSVGNDLPQVALCPVRDHAHATAMGYGLSNKEDLGHRAGEADGNILAWRDPFIFEFDNSLYMAFAAKNTSGKPAVGIGKFSDKTPSSQCELIHPMTLPDIDDYGQLEVPKLYPLASGDWLLLCATTDRRSEQQPATDVSTQIRLYLAPTPLGPWRTAGKASSILGNADHLFGATLIDVAESATDKLWLMAPFTMGCGDERALTFAPRFSIDTKTLDVADQINADHPGLA